jgi:hypothetical protein
VPFVTWADLEKAEKKALAREARERNKEAKRRTEAVGADIVGQASYEVFLFGDAAVRRLGIGWYEHQRAYSCSAHRFGSSFRVAAMIERDGPQWVAYGVVRPDGVDLTPIPWVKGERRRMLAPGEVVEEIGRTSTLDAAAALAAALFARHAILPSAPDAAWRTQPATEKQVDALRRWGVKRPNLSRGEASQLMDATTTRRKVREWLRSAT